MNVLDLFSGIGGFSLGLERAGMRTVAFCERDEYCRAVLRKHWPAVPCIDDIHAIDAERLGGFGRIDVVSGGFPCQPFSVAGKQRAQADDRHLWPQMRRVIALARPTWVIGENVTGLIPLALDDVLFDLEDLGYATRTFVIPACAVDAKHRRDRLWIIARAVSRDRDRDRESVGAVNDETSELRGIVADTNCAELRIKSGRSRGESRADTAQSRDDGAQESVANASGARLALGGMLGGIPSIKESRDTRENAAMDRDGEHAQDNSTDGARIRRREPSREWRPEPDVGRVAHGVPRRVDRLRALGNAVVPQIPEIIGRAIMRASA